MKRVKAGKKPGADNPRGKHLAGATAKEQRQYEAVLKSIRASGRYKGREKEVAARTVRARRNPTFEQMYRGEAGPALKAFADAVFYYAGTSKKTTDDRMYLVDKGLDAGVAPPRLKRLLAKSIGQKTANRLVNMRVLQRSRKNPYYLVTGKKREPRKTRDLIVLKADKAKDALARGKQLYAGKGYTGMKAIKQRNPDLDTGGIDKLPHVQRSAAQNVSMRWRLRDPDLTQRDVRYHLNADKTVSVFIQGAE